MVARDVLVAPCVLAGITAGTLLLALLTAQPHSDQLAAVFPPWWSPSRTFAAAASAGRLVARGSMPGAVIVRGEATTLANRLRSAGALLIVDPTFSVGCRTVASEIAR